MTNNKKKAGERQLNNRDKEPFHIKSTLIALQIIASVLQKIDQEIYRRERQEILDHLLPKVAYLSHLISIEEFFHKALAFLPQKAVFCLDYEPKPIAMDSLSHTYLEKAEAKNAESLVSKSRVSVLTLVDSKVATAKLKQKQRSVRLNLQTIQQSKIFGDFRQRKIDEEVEKAQRAHDEQQEAKRNAKKWQNKQQRVGFDYSGALLPRISKERSNLVQKVLEMKLRNQKTVQAKPSPPHPQSVGSILKKGYKKRDRSVKEQTEFLQFLDGQSLTDSVEITRGIRYQHNSLVFQEKKRTLSIADLKDGLGKRKMSKPQFARIRQHFEDRQAQSRKKLKTMKTQQKLQRSISQKRAFSECNFNDSRLRRRQGINIINHELRQSMLIRLQDYQSFLVLEKQFPPDYEYYYARENYQANQISVKVQQAQNSQLISAPQTPKLPLLLRTPTPPKIDHSSMILTNLRQQLLSKLQL